MVFGLGAERVRAEGEPDLKKIQAALDYYSRSITTLEGRYRHRQRRDADLVVAPPVGIIMRDLTREIEFAVDLRRRWECIDETKSWLFSEISDTQRFEAREITAFDGRQYVGLIHTLSKCGAGCAAENEPPSAVPHRLNTFPHPGPTIQFRPWEFAGLPLIRIGGTLADCLRMRSPKLSGMETVGDSECYRVEATGLTIWIDPRHGFLPRRIKYFDSRPDRPYVLDVFEFRQFPDPLHNTQHWFPVRARARWTDQIIDIEVHELALNPALSQEKFQIDPASLPPGVQVNVRSGQSPERWYTGGAEGERLWTERQRLIDMHDELLDAILEPHRARQAATAASLREAQAPGSPILADPLTSGSWALWLLVAASVLLITIGLIRVVRMRRARG